MRRRIVILIGILCLGIAFSAQAETYQIATVPWAGWSPVHVAQAKGFWKEAGVEVRVFNVADPMEVLQLFQEGLVDMAFAMMGTAVGHYMNGIPLVIVAETNWSHGGDKIIVKKAQAPAQLAQKPIGVYFNVPSVTFFLHQYLASEGIKLADTRILEMAPDLLADHFIAGQLGTIVCYDPHALRAVRQGNGRVVATSASYEGCIPEGMMMLRKRFESVPQADLTAIFQGWIQAVQWCQDPDNWKEYMQILNQQTFKGMAPYSETDLKAMVAAVRIHDPRRQLERNIHRGGLHRYLKEMHAFLSANGMLKKDFSPKALFENEAIVQALKAVVSAPAPAPQPERSAQ